MYLAKITTVLEVGRYLYENSGSGVNWVTLVGLNVCCRWSYSNQESKADKHLLLATFDTKMPYSI